MLRDMTRPDCPVIGVFLGGKTLKAGRVFNDKIEDSINLEIDNTASEERILGQVIDAISTVYSPDIAGIGIGVPSLVDVLEGIVYNVEHIPSWRRVHLADLLKKHFKTSIYVNNDANCFAIGEKYFGKGLKYRNMVGIVSGVGLGTGIIADDRLLSGRNCGAGEFGYIPYKDHNYEHYCTTSYFEIKYGLKPNTLYTRAKKEDKIALAVLEQFGIDFGNFIKTIMFAIDPELIVIGGNLTRFFPFFESALWRTIRKFPYDQTVERLSIETSETPDIEILGAGALYFDAERKPQS
ncbi:MAG: ROK family protein [Bacteroidota bacterium]